MNLISEKHATGYNCPNVKYILVMYHWFQGDSSDNRLTEVIAEWTEEGCGNIKVIRFKSSSLRFGSQTFYC